MLCKRVDGELPDRKHSQTTDGPLESAEGSSFRPTGDHFKIDREPSPAGIGPHRLAEGLPDQMRRSQVEKFPSGQRSAFVEGAF